MFLQLAEGENNGNYNALAEGQGDKYLFVPPNFMNNSESMYVRADYFDNLPDAQYLATMAALIPLQSGLSEDTAGFDFSGLLNKAQNVAGTLQNAGINLDLTNTSQEGLAQKFMSFKNKIAPLINTVLPGAGTAAQKVGEMQANIFGKLAANRAAKRAAKGKGPGIFSKLFAKGTPTAPTAPTQPTKGMNLPTDPLGATVQLPGGSFNVGFQPTDATTPTTGSFWQKYKTPLLIGGAAVAIVGGYYLLKKKK